MGPSRKSTGSPATAPRPRPRTKRSQAKPFCIELGWKELFGLLLFFFLLETAMFFVGVWAGQTIIFPRSQTAVPVLEAGTPDTGHRQPEDSSRKGGKVQQGAIPPSW